jgi:hypothetical protein
VTGRVVAVPFRGVPHLPADALAGKIVIDVNNYSRPRDGVVAELETGEVTAGELFQRYVPGARTVKAFSTIYFEHLVALARPAGAPDRSALPIAGDDAAAKESVAALLDRLGYDTVDVGAMAESWRVQQGSPRRPRPANSRPLPDRPREQDAAERIRHRPAHLEDLDQRRGRAEDEQQQPTDGVDHCADTDQHRRRAPRT